MKRLLIVCLLMCGGCAYDPPVKADHASADYQHNLTTCQASALAVRHQTTFNTPGSLIMSIFTSDEPERVDIRRCLTAKGYTLG
jgi:hypothetical protein